MESPMDERAVRDLAKEIAKNIKTEDDLNDFSKLLRISQPSFSYRTNNTDGI